MSEGRGCGVDDDADASRETATTGHLCGPPGNPQRVSSTQCCLHVLPCTRLVGVRLCLRGTAPFPLPRFCIICLAPPSSLELPPSRGVQPGSRRSNKNEALALLLVCLCVSRVLPCGSSLIVALIKPSHHCLATDNNVPGLDLLPPHQTCLTTGLACPATP